MRGKGPPSCFTFPPGAKHQSTLLMNAGKLGCRASAEMRRASQEIARDPERMRAAEQEGVAPQVRNFVSQAERGHGRETGGNVEKDEGLER